MSFDLPSVVFKNKTVEETLNKIKTENRSFWQKLRKASKLDARDIQICTSQKNTLATYREIINGLEGATQFVSTPKRKVKD